ncbi:hypothetical protein AVEN_141934-1 [Araneus ventricosus]|uniref:Uncharacterized protein n=1 Tax=Araneus ventricosus TaxID=182803 RepID=A0A4Y2PIE6_ARAVE|nr:hypothetical protein AVEN_141934-1 [Araneus ventricosus]
METFVTTLYPCQRQGFQNLLDKFSLLSGFLSCQPQTAGQLHLVVVNETCTRVMASHREPPQSRGINICQRAHYRYPFVSPLYSPVMAKPKNLLHGWILTTLNREG